MEEGQEQSDFARLIIEKPQLLNERNPTNQSAERKVAKGWFGFPKAMKSSPLLGPFCGSEFWGFSLMKI